MSHGMIRFIATLFLACLSLMAQGVEEVIYYHNDALGSPIIATDQEGRVVWRKSYAPYGQPIGQTAPNEPGYTGKFEESDLGIQNFGARWYDPRIGRFLAIDPAGFDPQNPQSFNRYAYANNNPYKYVDPDGRVPLDTIWDFGNVVYDVANGNWGDAAIDAGAMLIPFVPAGITKLRHVDDAAEAVGGAAQVAKGIQTPHGLAVQADTGTARAALHDVQSGAAVYRQGSFGVQNTTDAQFWSIQNPANTGGFANKMGMPGSAAKPDWIMGGRVRRDSPAITRPAPGIGSNSGGDVEAVVPPGGVENLWFHMPD
jgi:RHS repeat-associated protein